jgi:predicted methyltransferase
MLEYARVQNSGRRRAWELAMIRHSWIAAIALLILLAPRLETRAAEVPDFIAAAVADPNRPDADRQRDANRKPAQTLVFAGVRQGQQIAELLPGGGYFTRIFSKAVGDSGHIYALVPAPSPTAAADAPDFSARIKALAKDPHYGNVSVVVEPFSQLNVPVPVDLVWTSQNYHDLHNFPGLDLTVFNQMVFAALKPGGIYLILDHAAAAGSGTRDTKTLHRIDAEAVKREVLAAGFVFDGPSTLLRNSDDPHTSAVFDPQIRGKTDQFMLKFHRPAQK